MTPERAEILGLEALGWVAGDDDARERFLAVCGIDGGDLRAAAGRPETGVAVIDFLLAHEGFMMRFCEDASCDPKTLHLARHALDPA